VKFIVWPLWQYTWANSYSFTNRPREVPTLKNRKPFTLTSEEETKIVGYINETPSTYLDLSATDTRRYEFQTTRKGIRGKLFTNDRFVAGWVWCDVFWANVRFIVRPPDTSSVIRAAASTDVLDGDGWDSARIAGISSTRINNCIQSPWKTLTPWWLCQWAG
jgi:hypothetical protein